MKSILFLFSILLVGFTSHNNWEISIPLTKNKGDFVLTYTILGLGQNTYYMQPAFRVHGTKFVYTYEEMWVMPNQKPMCDTLLMGDFRTSSIDSISNLINNIKDTVIHKINISITGGGERKIEISTAQKKIRFQLFNTSDTIANKIIAILNPYMSGEKEKQLSAKYY